MDKAKMEALSRAMELEIDGRKFYLEAAGKSQNEVGKKMFHYLADQELHHQSRIKEIYERLERGQEWPKGVLSIPPQVPYESIFSQAAQTTIKGAEGDKQAIELALKMEDQSYSYYDELSKKAAGLFERRFFAALCFEERGHYLMLLDSLDYLSDPAGWYSRHEHQQLEG